MSALSKHGRSSCTSEAQCRSSIAAAAAAAAGPRRRRRARPRDRAAAGCGGRREKPHSAAPKPEAAARPLPRSRDCALQGLFDARRTPWDLPFCKSCWSFRVSFQVDTSWTSNQPVFWRTAMTAKGGSWSSERGWAASPRPSRSAARGFHVTTLDAADGPGGKMREVEAGGRRIDAGPTVLTMRWVFEQIFEDAGARLSRQVTLNRACDWRAMPGPTARGSISIPTSTKPQRRSRISQGRARRTAIAAFAGAPSRIYRTLRDTFIRGSRPGPVELAARVGLSRLPDLMGDFAVHDAVARARRSFRGSAPAPVVRAIRHLLRLLAVPRAGDADAGRACRA